MVSNNSASAIVLLLIAIGVTFTSYFEITSIFSSSYNNTEKEVSLASFNPDSIGSDTFYLTDFYYQNTDLDKLDNSNLFLLLYENEFDTIARIGIEIRNKKDFRESYTQNKKVLVDSHGSMYKVETNGSYKLFGYGDLSSKSDIVGNFNIDQSLKSRSMTLRFIAEKNLSKNWLEVLFWIVFPIFLFLLGFVFLKKAIKDKDF